MAARRILSGIQPTGLMHIGNYFGAIRNWVGLQDPDAGGTGGPEAPQKGARSEPEGRASADDGNRAECFYCVVDYHSITVRHDPKVLRERSINLAMDLLACGIDPERSALFLQSQVPEHTELAWVLAAVTSYGDLQRMTQFKDKSDAQEFISAGLFTYPILMAADILVYKATHVPVGADQKQHLEQTADIGQRFNHWFGETFPAPQPLFTKATKIQSLADPTKKMSKSAGDKHYIGVFEDEESARKKLKSAVTATGGTPANEMQPGIANLFQILEQTAPASVIEPLLAAEREGKLKYSELKDAVSTHLMAMLKPFREKRAAITEKRAKEILAAGGDRARAIARATMAEVRDRIGLYEVR